MLREIEKIIHQTEEFKRLFIRAIEELPDNPRITRLDGRSNIFTIHSKDMGLVFSPVYHDFRSQYRKLAEIVRNTRLENIGRVLGRIVDTGRYFENGGTLTFHPEVIEHLRVLLGPPPPAPAQEPAPAVGIGR